MVCGKINTTNVCVYRVYDYICIVLAMKTNNMKPKTIRDHFQKLPILYRELAMGYANPSDIDTTEPTLTDSLYASFIWANTKEGHEFWSAIACDARFHESKTYRNEFSKDI